MFSFQIGKPFGIPLRIHGTLAFFVLLAAVSLQSLTLAIAWSAIVFASVALHELGHALVARAFGVRVLDIVLHPLGGMARMAGIPRSPAKEITIAAAGPIVSLALAGLAFAAAVLGSLFMQEPAVLAATIAWQINLALGLFNLLPAFPLDGGRMLRAALATRRPYIQATRTAVRVSQVLAVCLGVFGLFESTWLIFIAVFIWVTAKAELQATELDELYRNGMPWGTVPAPRPAGREGWIRDLPDGSREFTLPPDRPHPNDDRAVPTPGLFFVWRGDTRYPS